MVIWLIGLSGVGKTTLANKVITDVNKKTSNTILLDGDTIREVFDNDLGYTMEDRLINAKRICKLGQFLDQKGINVICSILSIFPETRAWNRENITNYYEIFIDTPIETLVARDSKGIYGKFKRGEISDVAGMDIDFPIPNNPDLIINNNGSKVDLLKYSEKIVELLRKNSW